MRLARIAGVTIAALLALAAPAAGLENLGDADVISGTLYLTGDGVTLADGESRDTDGFAVVRTSASGRTVLDRLRPPPGGQRFYQYTDLGASAERYAYDYAEYMFGGIEDEPVRFAFLSGAPPAAATPLLECQGDPGEPNVAVSGNAVAYQPGACTGRSIGVRDFAPGAPVPTRTIALDQQVSDLKLSGHYLAYMLTQGATAESSPARQIVVYDWVAGAEVYRARSSEAAPFMGGTGGAPFDLQADGKVAVTTAPAESELPPPDRCPDRYGVAWFSPAEPTAHLLPQGACEFNLRIEADHIAFMRSTGGNGGELTVADLAGSTVGVARFAHHHMLQDFDFDGTRAALAVKGCERETLHIEAAAPAAETTFEVPRCPIKISSSAGRIDSKRRAAIRYRCPNGCELESRIQKPFGSEYMATRIRAGHSGTMRFAVPASARAKLAQKGSLRLRVMAAIGRSRPVQTRKFYAWVTLKRGVAP